MQKQNPFMKLTNAQWWGWFAVALFLGIIAALFICVGYDLLPYGIRNIGAVLCAVAATFVCVRWLIVLGPPHVKIDVTDEGVVLKNGIAPFEVLTWNQIIEVGIIYSYGGTITTRNVLHRYLVYLSIRPLTDQERVNCDWVRSLGKDGSVVVVRVRWWKKEATFDPEIQQLLERADLLRYAADARQLGGLWHQKHPDQNIRCMYTQMKDRLTWKVSEETYDKLRCEPEGKFFWIGLLLMVIWYFTLMGIILPML